MMSNLMITIGQILIGFSGGLAVGAGFVAFLTMLGIIPRLIQLSKSNHLVKVFIACIIFGSIFGTYLSFTDISFSQSSLMLIIWGIVHGIFNGMLVAALTEVLNVFPLLSKRVGMERYLIPLLMAIVFGKIFGSLFQWVIFVKY